MKIQATDIVTEVLSAYGVKYAVVSSGSRSLRMVSSLADCDNIDVRMVVDERVAAFVALGIVDATQTPVVLVCTSGSAVLNFAPAIAEAYYRAVPLIIISADRPREVIDINDGQCIHQYNALANIVKESIDVDGINELSAEDIDSIEKIVSNSLSPRKGPVHINIHLSEGHNKKEVDNNKSQSLNINPRQLTLHCSMSSIDNRDILNKKILIFVGQNRYDSETQELLKQISNHRSIVVIADAISNCQGGHIITDIESIILKVKDNSASFAPDLLVTLGKTSPVSRNFKEWLRELTGLVHWRVNDTDRTEDTYYHLSRTIVAEDKFFYKYLIENLSSGPDYQKDWLELSTKANKIKKDLLSKVEWSDLCALNLLIKQLPNNSNIHSSNGLTIRYLSLLGVIGHNLYCNRGVNGIDGSTSTAIGFSTLSDDPTLLLSGDMSALYDIAALFSGQLSPKFKMIIINNGGGEIFRMIKATRDYEQREHTLCKMPDVDWQRVAGAVGMTYFEADNEGELNNVIPQFFLCNNSPALLVIKTYAGNSIVYSNIIKELNELL